MLTKRNRYQEAVRWDLVINTRDDLVGIIRGQKMPPELEAKAASDVSSFISR